MELITKMRQIGLSKREAEVYIALLQKKEFTVPELTKITTITRTKIYEVLQNLIHEGMCNENNKNRLKLYRAVKPKIILQSVISNLELEIEQQNKAAIEQQNKAAIEQQNKAAIEQKKVAAVEQKKIVAMSLEKELTSLYEDKQHNLDPLDYIEVLTDIGQIRERWVDIQKNTKKELIVFTKPPYSTPSIEDNIEIQSEWQNRGVISKSIYEYNNLNSKEIENLIKSIEAYQKIGEQARIIKDLPMKLAISDENITMLALNDRISLKPSITTIIIDHPSFATALKKVFESYWMNAITLDEFRKMLKK